MGTISHKTLGYAEGHVCHAFEYANAAARTGASPGASDVGKICKQSDDNSFWVLINHSPVTWYELTPTSLDVITSLKLASGATLTEFSTDGTLDGDSDAAAPTEKAVRTFIETVLKGYVQRPKFEWKDADEIYINPGVYHHKGTTEQFVYWNSKLTFQFGSGGSNGSSDDLEASKRFYLFLDDSAIVTQGSPLLDADCFIAKCEDNVTLTWNDTEKGFYEDTATKDRLIGGFTTNASSQIETFWHDGGDYFEYDAYKVDANDVEPAVFSSFTDLTLSIPEFCQKAMVHFWVNGTNGAAVLYWRTNGSTAGYHIGASCASGDSDKTPAMVITDGSQKIEWSKSADNSDDTHSAVTDGWFFPTGM